MKRLFLLLALAQLAKMDKFAWFMIWTGFTADRYNTPEDLKAIFTLPNVVNYKKPNNK